ncbi:MAG: hypothetical protein ACRC2K_11550, partial [Clostridium sp.]
GIKGVSKVKGCTLAEDVKKSIRASFQFIKDNPLIIGGRIAYTYITLGVFLIDSIDSTKSQTGYGITDVSGEVKKVCESYVVLTSRNVNGQEFNIRVVYEEIVYFWNQTINENFDAYVNYINGVIPPVCEDSMSESYNLLSRIDDILSGKKNMRDFVFILNRVLTRRIDWEGIVVLRNLVISDELFVTPITSIQGFVQVPN